MYERIHLPNRYQAVVWDWNGTLVDDAWLCIYALNTLLEKRRRPLETLDLYRRRFRFPVRSYYEELGFDFQVEDIQALSLEYISAYNARRFECRLQAGSRELLAEFSARGLRQMILSAYQQDMLRETIGHYNLTSFFESIRGLQNLQALGKSELGRELLNATGLAPEKVLLIGDTEHDGEVADSLGVDCLLVGHGHYAWERLRTMRWPAVASFADWAESRTIPWSTQA